MLKIDLVSPSGQLMTGKEITSLVIPSVMGELTILPGHIDMVSSIGKGIMTVGETDKFVIYGGIIEISNGSDIIVAADRIKKISDIDASNVIAELKEVENKLTNEILSDHDLLNANAKHEDLQAELGAIKQS